MRRIEREQLPAETANALQQFQNEADALRETEDFDPVQHWNGKRKSQPVQAALTALRRMAGKRERCMYCVDSQASDIEHFWPKSPHPQRLYEWHNLLFVCTLCGCFKGSRFPLSASGDPLLIDPSAEDPWEFLDFDPVTGNINARYLRTSAAYSPKGETTVNVLHLDKREGVSSGYRKTYRRLCELVTAWTDEGLAPKYLEQLREADDHGLLGWFLHGTGRNEPAFQRFRERFQDAWAACEQSLR